MKGKRSSLRERQKQGYKRREGDLSGLFKDNVDIPFWKCGEGEHLIDIIPYLAGKNDPLMEEGKETYVLEVFVHQNVGIDEGMKICLAKTFGKSCPICEDRKKKQQEGADEDLIKLLTPSRYPRSIYNIVCYDSDKEEDKGVQVWHTSSYLMESTLLELAKNPVRAGGKNNAEPFICFADPDEGKSISFNRKGLGENTRFVGHKFVDRDYELSDEILDEAFCLDDLIHIPTYEEVKNWYVAENDEETEEVEEEEDELPKSTPRRVRDHSKRIKHEDQGEGARRPATRTRKENVEENEKSPMRSRRRKQNEEEPEKPETEIRRRKKVKPKSKSEPVCPYGGEFGVDIDELEACDTCELWVECAKKADENN